MDKRIKFIDKTPEAKKIIQKTIEKGLIGAAEIIKGQMKALTPVGRGTGHLRETLDRSEVKISGNRGSVEVGSPLNYAVYVEFGTGEFAENGAGRKGGWAWFDETGKYTEDGEPGKVFTMGIKPVKFMRKGAEVSKGKATNYIKKVIGQA